MYSIITFTLQLNSYEVLPSAIFRTSRGHRCRPFSPPVRAFNFIVHRVQHSHCSSIFIEGCELTLSRFPLIKFYARKSPYEYVHSVEIEPTKKKKLVGTRITYTKPPAAWNG